MSSYIKIFGQQRSGTNFLEKLLKDNLKNTKILVNEFCDKHQKLFLYDKRHKEITAKEEWSLEKEIKKAETFIHSVVIVKNPYSWFNSLKKWRIYCNNVPPGINEMHRYKDYYDHYKTLSAKNYPMNNLFNKFLIIKYEDLISDPHYIVKILNQIIIKFNINMDPFSDISQINIPKKVNLSNEFDNNQKDFYLGKNDTYYNLSKQEINLMNSVLNPEEYGYETVKAGKTIYIDIDDTICERMGDSLDYENSTPIQKNIDKANKLFDEGNYIVYWTARGTVTGKDWREVTEKQFEEWGVKYHELRFGKPAYDLFIDDKNINTTQWE